MSRSLNPYIAGNPVGNSNAFTGRADIVREVLHIFSRPEENAIVLYGQRRIGKTSVLQFLKKTLAQEKATGHYFPVYFDLQDKATFSLGDVLKELANTIANELGFPAPQLGDNPEHSFQYEWLPEQLAKLAKGAALVLLLDEFDVLAAESAKGAGADFFPYLRKLIASDRQRLNFVFVIGRNVSDLNTIALSLFKGVPTRRISLLNEKDTFELIRLAEKTSPLRWRADALERIWQLTNGHAFFTQQLCSFAWEEAYDDGDFTSEEIGADIVDSVIDDALSASRNAFEWLWDGLPPAERVVSAALAQAGGRAVTETELEKLLHESGVRIVIRELQDAPKLLQDWDLLEPVDGGFRFRVELLRRWIAENKPLRRVQDELDRIEPVAESLFQAAQGLYKNSQLESAENLLRQAIGLNPNHVKANKLLADLLLAGGNYVDAKTLLASLYEYQPIEARSRLVQAWLGLASMVNADDEKLACYEEILKLDSNQTEAKKAYKSILELKGDYALQQGLTTDALYAYKKAGQSEKVVQLEQTIREAEVKEQLHVLGALEQKKKYSEALNLIKNLAEKFPDLLDWGKEQNRIKQLIMIAGNYQQALDEIKLANWKQAQELLALVIGVDPEFEDAAIYLCLAVTGDDCRVLNENLNKANNDNKKIIEENSLVKNQINDYENTISQFETDIKRLIEEKNSISYQLAESNHRVSSFNLELNADKNTIKSLNESNSNLKIKLKNTLSKNDSLNIKRKRIEKILIKQISELKTLLKNLEHEKYIIIKSIEKSENRKCAEEAESKKISAIYLLFAPLTFLIVIGFHSSFGKTGGVIISVIASVIILLIVRKSSRAAKMVGWFSIAVYIALAVNFYRG